jgi:transcription initiation factor IIE alpha subunit
METVTITDAHDTGYDEACGHWFRCPKCKKDLIMIGFNFCPNCGIGIKYVEQKESYKSLSELKLQ